MKIVCMDCQNESYADLESFKANSRVVCAQCAEDPRPTAYKEDGAGEPVALDQHQESHPVSLYGSSVETELPAHEDEVLDLSEAVVIPEQLNQGASDNVFQLPELETQAPLSEEEVCLDQNFDSLLSAETRMPEGESHQVSPEAQLLSALPGQVEDSVIDAQPSEVSPSIEAERIKGMRLMPFSMPKQIVLAGACILAIVLVQALATPSNQAGVKAESISKQDSPAVPESRPTEAATTAPVSLNNPNPSPSPSPSPSPAIAVEEKPTAVPPSQDLPVEKPKGLFTLQVGSHQKIEEANNQADKLKAAGLEPRVVSAEIPKRGTWYRVQVGDFSTREEANSFGATLRAKGIADNFIVSGL